MRSRALSRVTRAGSVARPLLFFSCNSLPNRDEIVHAFSESSASAAGGTSVGGHTRYRRVKATATATGCNDATGTWSSSSIRSVEGGRVVETQQEVTRSGAQGVFSGMRERRWLLILARAMARPREFERRRAAAVRAFTPQKFRQEWELFWELLDPIADAFENNIAVSADKCIQWVGQGVVGSG